MIPDLPDWLAWLLALICGCALIGEGMRALAIIFGPPAWLLWPTAIVGGVLAGALLARWLDM